MNEQTYTTVQDIIDLIRPLTDDEIAKAPTLIKTVEAILKQKASFEDKNIDDMITSGYLQKIVFVSVVADIVARNLVESNSNSNDSEQLTNFTQSALGYTFSGTYLNAGGGIFIKRDEYRRIGLNRQKARYIECE